MPRPQNRQAWCMILNKILQNPSCELTPTNHKLFPIAGAQVSPKSFWSHLACVSCWVELVMSLPTEFTTQEETPPQTYMNIVTIWQTCSQSSRWLPPSGLLSSGTFSCRLYLCFLIYWRSHIMLSLHRTILEEPFPLSVSKPFSLEWAPERSQVCCLEHFTADSDSSYQLVLYALLMLLKT